MVINLTVIKYETLQTTLRNLMIRWWFLCPFLWTRCPYVKWQESSTGLDAMQQHHLLLLRCTVYSFWQEKKIKKWSVDNSVYSVHCKCDYKRFSAGVKVCVFLWSWIVTVIYVALEDVEVVYVQPAAIRKTQDRSHNSHISFQRFYFFKPLQSFLWHITLERIWRNQEGFETGIF